MLLKIYTNKGSLRVIENIEHVEVHSEVHYIKYSNANTYSDKPIEHAPGSLEYAHGQQLGPCPIERCDYFDDIIGKQAPVILGQPDGWPIKFIDYCQHGSYWKRVAIGFFGTAYLCNDLGKTIERINEPGRQAA